MKSDGAPALALGAVLGDGDPESMAWSRAIGALSMQATELVHGLDSPLRLNVVYHVDGRLVPNDFEGVRTGRFNRAAGVLVVQAAISKDVSGDKREHLVGLLSAAVDEAARYARKRALADHLLAVRGVVTQLAGALPT